MIIERHLPPPYSVLTHVNYITDIMSPRLYNWHYESDTIIVKLRKQDLDIR